ncbi:MAG: hydroxymethylbilane synthase [Ferruginibacter sp.]|nr:hydroxymethylbilane synthase [Ferruginibacter sp.]
MRKLIRIGTRESQLAVWQATLVQNLLSKNNYQSQLVYIKSEGDIDLKTPLYDMGVQGIFTRSLDIALLNDQIDIAVHSMKDVPTQLARGTAQAAVLERASHKDIFVYKDEGPVSGWKLGEPSEAVCLQLPGLIATSSIRRKAQWLNRYPDHVIENLRGNVNTRLRKVAESNWNGAIFAAAGLERINLRPEKAIDLDWMLPAPAQGAIMVVCREEDEFSKEACQYFNHMETALCTKVERDFLRALLGGCSTPISALAVVKADEIYFRGNIISVDGKEKVTIEKTCSLVEATEFGRTAAEEILQNGGDKIAEAIRNGAK